MNNQVDKAIRIGIVGGGPRGLFCLERLAIEFGNICPALRRPVHITLFETAEHPGAGTIYALQQPDYLLMNFSVGNIDIWSEESHLDFPGVRQNLNRWLMKKYPELSAPHHFVPRSMVGEYLHDGFRRVAATLPDGMSLEVVAERAGEIVEDPSGWIVKTDRSNFSCDEVIVTVGHEGWRPVSESSGERRVFPVDRQLSVASIPPGSKVAVRGFSLTFIDAALALTEGRGGKFSKGGGYERSGSEPRSITPFSRSGRPMLAKPDYSQVRIPDRWNDIWGYYGRKISDHTGEVNFSGDIMPLVSEAADEAANRDTAGWFQSFLAPTPALEKMRVSYEAATGKIPAGESLALAEAWRNLYPEIVRLLEHGGLGAKGWPSYLYYSSELERIAFGPSAINVAKMLALVEEGIVLVDETVDSLEEYDCVIDARMPPPDSLAKDSPLRKLQEQGYVRRLNGNRGIEIGRSGYAISSSGDPVAGLAVVGRATEGCVIGNDTLSRTLNTHIDRWAQSVGARHFHQLSQGYEFSTV
ncbi:MAG: FAD/NAD(P)-binding protein [Verrucomicrobiales bacterium]|nr:FAD/NAD(P)-binding protein [Verrucomicrobiales bacterium]